MLPGYIQLWDVLLIRMIVGQEPIVLAVGRDVGLFFLFLFFLSCPSLSLLFLHLSGRQPDLDLNTV